MVYTLTQGHALQIPLFCKEGLGDVQPDNMVYKIT